MTVGTQTDAIERTIEALGDHVRPTHSALLALCRGLASEIDEPGDDDRGRAALWREYRTAVTALVSLGAEVPDPDEGALTDQLSTPVGDKADAKPANPRASNRGGNGKRRTAANAVATTRSRRGRGATT